MASHELLKCLNKNGLIFIQTHQTYPLHGYPNDYFRFSLDALDSLFPKTMNTEILAKSYNHPCRIIPFDKLWDEYNRVIKPNGVIILFGSEPFSSMLRTSNIKMYKYDWYWLKNKPQGFLNAKKMPLKNYETISVFYKNSPIYNPQGLVKIDRVVKNTGTKNSTSLKENGDKTSANNAIKNVFYSQEFTNYPTQTLEFSNCSGKGNSHPTQKPLELLEYLVKTYTNDGDTVLDNTMGSGTTNLACIKLNRKSIGIEKEKQYYDVAVRRASEYCH